MENAPTSGMSFFEMVGSSGLIVQLVLLILIGFSVLTWAIILFKWGAFKRSKRATNRFLDFFWSGKSMDLIYTEAKKNSASAVAKVFQSGYIELQRLMERERQKSGGSKNVSPPETAVSNLERALSKTSRTELIQLEGSLPFLATTGSTAPFIGLFGTVWGIMNAFQSIGAEGGAGVGAVSQGISEALLATAVGLFAAIPAVMGYNYYIQKIRGIKAQIDSFSEDFLNIVRRNFLSG